MPAGRPPKPAHLKLLEGNPGKRPIPTNEIRPSRGEMPVPPAFLTPHARAEWDRIAEQCWNLGLLTECDLSPFVSYCQAYGRWVVAETELSKYAEQAGRGGLLVAHVTGTGENKRTVYSKNPMVSQAAAAARDMVKYAVEFGLTPAARARIAAAERTPQKGKFDGLIA